MFGPDGTCHGAGLFSGSVYYLSAYRSEEPDPDIPGDFGIPGFEEGDKVVFRLYRQSSGETIELSPPSGEYHYSYSGEYPPMRIDLAYGSNDSGPGGPAGGGTQQGDNKPGPAGTQPAPAASGGLSGNATWNNLPGSSETEEDGAGIPAASKNTTSENKQDIFSDEGPYSDRPLEDAGGRAGAAGKYENYNNDQSGQTGRHSEQALDKAPSESGYQIAKGGDAKERETVKTASMGSGPMGFMLNIFKILALLLLLGALILLAKRLGII
jgi:hypothetical protein